MPLKRKPILAAAFADVTGKTYSASGLKIGSIAYLYNNGVQAATATVDNAGKATWTLGNAVSIGSFVFYYCEGLIGGLLIAGPTVLTISGASGTANVGDTASFSPTISGGTAPYIVTATGLPPGRAIQTASTGLTTGAYTTAGTYSNIVYTVTDSTGATATMTRSVVVSAAAALVGFYKNGSANSALKAALAGVKAGTRRATIVQEGDSTTTGQGGGTGSAGLIGAKPFGPGPRIAAALTTLGYPAHDQSRIGDGGVGAGGVTIAQYDPRVSIPSSTWTITNPNNGYSSLFYNNNGGVEPWKITPTQSRDTDIVFYTTIGGGATFTNTVGGAAPLSGGTVNTAGSTALLRTVIKSSSVGVGELAMTPSGANAYVAGCYSYDSTVPGVDVLTFGCCGAVSSLVAGGTTFGPLALLNIAAPDLTIINMGLNNMNGGGDTAAYTSPIQTAITEAKKSGDVLLVFPNPAGGNYNTNVANMNDALKALAVSNNVAFFSLWEYYGPFTTAFGARMFDGLVHPKAELYNEIGGLEAQAIMAMIA